MNRKWLRFLGVALVSSPEPLTTPAGVALLGITYFLSKRQNTKNDRHARELVSFYLAHAGLFNNGVRHGVPVTSKNVIHHTLNRGLFARYGNVGGLHADSQRPNLHNVPMGAQKVVHHTLNRGLFARYGNVGGLHADSLRPNLHNVSAALGKVKHHALKRSLQTRKLIVSSSV